ncbi:MAG: phosphatase PAP2-related protein [Candidatus Taylorbacteria bacterium]
MRNRWKNLISDKTFIFSLIVGVILLCSSLIINYYAQGYAVNRESSPVADIVLSNIPVFNVDVWFMYGPLVLGLILFISCIRNPCKIPLLLKSAAIFVTIRAIFITFTHIGPYPDHNILDSMDFDFLKTFSTSANFFIFSGGADLFFSGHTGMPFLAALIYWDNKLMRYICLFSSFFFGILALLGHLHYTIDVASAFFITYTIYVIIKKLIPHDVAMFEEKEFVSQDVLHKPL